MKRPFFLLAFVLGIPATSFADTSTAARSLEDHNQIIESLDKRIDDLQLKIQLTQDHVNTLKVTALGQAVAKCKAVVSFHNEMGTFFELEQAKFILDGKVILEESDKTGVLDDREEFQVFNGPIKPGLHKVRVSLTYRGSSLGFITYLEGYKFKVDSKYDFRVQDGQLNNLGIVAYSKGDFTTETTDRLAVRYDHAVEPATSILEEGETSGEE